MPSYEHLLDNKMNFDAIEPHVKAANLLGAEYSEEDLEQTAEVAYRQAERIAADIVAQGGPANTMDTQAVALIAYLQRVGIDLFRTPEPETKPGESDAEASTSDESASGESETTTAAARDAAQDASSPTEESLAVEQ